MADNFYTVMSPYIPVHNPLFKNSSKNALDLFPNLRFIVLVRDPRSLAASRLTRALSKTARKTKFFDFLESWISIMTVITKMCDDNNKRCFYLRYEDLLERPGAVLKNTLSTKARISALRGPFYDFKMNEFPENANSTKWKDFVPEGTIDKLRNHEDLLRRFRYPLDHLSSESRSMNPLDNIEAEFDLYELEHEAAVNFWLSFFSRFLFVLFTWWNLKRVCPKSE